MSQFHKVLLLKEMTQINKNPCFGFSTLKHNVSQRDNIKQFPVLRNTVKIIL